MPQVRALTSFKGRLGSIRKGMQFHCDPGYIAELNKKIKQVEVISSEDTTSEPGPSSNKNVPRAPAQKDQGKAPAGSTPPAATGSDPAAPVDDGSARPFVSSLPDRPSHVTTRSSSAPGAIQPVTTQRRRRKK